MVNKMFIDLDAIINFFTFVKLQFSGKYTIWN